MNNKYKDITISEEELFAELEKYPQKLYKPLTEQEMRVIEHGRELGIEWHNIAIVINDKFGHTFTRHTLSSKYRRETK